MIITIANEYNQSGEEPTLYINGIDFKKLPEAPARAMKRLARAKTRIDMNGPKKSGYFPLIINGELIPVSVSLNELTKYSKLAVGKNIVTAKQRAGY